MMKLLSKTISIIYEIQVLISVSFTLQKNIFFKVVNKTFYKKILLEMFTICLIQCYLFVIICEIS